MAQTADSMSTRDNGGSRSVGDIERDIAATRREMSRTIDEIQYRLSPNHMKHVAKERMRTMAHDTSTNLMDRIKQNPGAIAVVGIGLWMMFRDRSNGGHIHDWQTYATDSGDQDVFCNACGAVYVAEIDDPTLGTSYGGGSARYGSGTNIRDRARGAIDETTSSVRDRASHVADTTREKMDDVRERLHDTSERIEGTASQFANRARSAGWQMQSRARRATNVVSDRFEENPIILGAIGIAMGAVLGALIPESRREHQLYGEASDRVIDRATSMAREKIDSAKQVARSAKDAAVDEAKEEARRQNLTSGSENDREAGNRIV